MSVPGCSVVILVDLLAVDREDERWDEGLCVIADRPLSEGLSLLPMPSKVLPLGIIRFFLDLWTEEHFEILDTARFFLNLHLEEV